MPPWQQARAVLSTRLNSTYLTHLHLCLASAKTMGVGMTTTSLALSHRPTMPSVAANGQSALPHTHLVRIQSSLPTDWLLTI